MPTKLKSNPYKDVVELHDDLKDAVKAHYNLTKGKATLDEKDIAYLNGIKDAGATPEIKQAVSALILQITKHKKVELYIE